MGDSTSNKSLGEEEDADMSDRHATVVSLPPIIGASLFIEQGGCRGKRNKSGQQNRGGNSRSVFSVKSRQSLNRAKYTMKPLTKDHPLNCRKVTDFFSALPWLALFLVHLAFSPTIYATEIDPKSTLPTVIVRGFLNYRTTVDGTVLLFTPDAGTGSSSISVVPTNNLNVVASTMPAMATGFHEISPTSVTHAPLATMSTSPQPVANRGDSSNGWHPFQATPPLHPAQTSLKPPTQAPDNHQAAEQPRAAPPSVQADDINDSARPSNVPSSTGSSAPNTGPNQSGQSPARAIRPKRPTLGFNGHGLRPKQTAVRTPSDSSSPSSIHGLRRPSLTGSSSTSFPSLENQPTSASSAVGPQANPAVASASAAAFQSRLSSARLRNKLRRPGGASLSGTSAGSSAGSRNILAPEASAVSSMLSAESGEDLVIGSDPQAVAASRAISPDTSTELQPRMGELSVLSGSTAPAVGSDEILAVSEAPESPASELVAERGGSYKPQSRSGEIASASGQTASSGALSGAIDVQQGQLSNMPLSFEGFFQNDQPSGRPQAESSEQRPSHVAKDTPKSPGNHQISRPTGNNDKLNGWLDQHHNKFIPRQPGHNSNDQGHYSQQLANKLNQLMPSFSSSISQIGSTTIKPTPALQTASSNSLHSSMVLAEELAGLVGQPGSVNITSESSSVDGTLIEGKEQVQMQTITKTYSTVMTSAKTRLVPLQVNSTTAVHTITENYVITQVLTAYQTMPIGEFILPEPQSTRTPFEIFNEPSPSTDNNKISNAEQPIPAPAAPVVPAPAEPQEQPISLEQSSKSPNDWLHDFSNPNTNSQPQSNQQQLLAMLEQQAQEANLAGLPGLVGEPLDQLASSLNPAALFAEGGINIPDLNNPIVLAAAIQNPQLAAVILAAQQLQLKQRQAKLAAQTGQLSNQSNQLGNQQQSVQTVQLQPSYSTSLSTTIKPSTYTMRDTMYTTRLVSFKDGRTVRTRTVSEPGSVIEQVITTMATEITPVTITIRPTGLLTVLAGNAFATQAPHSGLQSSQTTLNNALIASQLAGLLARRQQQLSAPNPSMGQLAAFQQMLGQQQQQQQQQQEQQLKQFQPNIQQLLQSMRQSPNSLASGSRASNDMITKQPVQGTLASPTPSTSKAAEATQALQTAPILSPMVTTLTSLQVRTYTVHNAFKTIYRTITSTQLITTTLFPGVRPTQLAG